MKSISAWLLAVFFLAQHIESFAQLSMPMASNNQIDAKSKSNKFLQRFADHDIDRSAERYADIYRASYLMSPNDLH